MKHQVDSQNSRRNTPIARLAELFGSSGSGFISLLPRNYSGKALRTKQLFYSFIQLVLLSVRRTHFIAFQGNYFIHGKGRFSLTANPPIVQLLSSIFNLKPFVLIHCEHRRVHPMSRLCAAIEADIVDVVEGKQAAADVITLNVFRNGRPVHASLSFDSDSHFHVRNEHKSISRLSAMDDDTGFSVLCPLVLDFNDQSDFCCLILSHIEGIFISAKAGDDDAYLRVLQLATQPLFIEFEKGDIRPDGPDKKLISTDLAKLPSAYPKHRKILNEILIHLQAWDSHNTLRSVRVHGDYHLGNILFCDNLIDVKGIIDWDRFKSDGLPLFDALHLFVSTSAKRHGCHYGKIIPSIWDHESTISYAHPYFNFLCAKFNFSRHDLRMIGCVLWLNYLWLAYEEKLIVTEAWVSLMIEEPYEAFSHYIYSRDRALNQTGDVV